MAPCLSLVIYTWCGLNLGVDLNISDVGNFEMTNIQLCHLTFMVDTENSGVPSVSGAQGKDGNWCPFASVCQTGKR